MRAGSTSELPGRLPGAGREPVGVRADCVVDGLPVDGMIEMLHYAGALHRAFAP